MPFVLDRYSRIRPLLYHLTARKNIERIRALRRIDSTTALLAAAANEEGVEEGAPIRRTATTPISIGLDQVLLRDQAPLYRRNIQFTDGWELEDLVEETNRRVFFWSGWEHGPISYGVRHFKRYQVEHPLILRVPFAALRRCNAEQAPFFCKYNSGSPRRFQGRGSPRGPDTFLPADRCSYNPGNGVEVTFVGSETLPDDTEVSDHVEGPWRRLFDGS